MRKLCVWVATGFGLGYSPVAPGTAGALLGLPLVWALQPLPLPWRTVAAAALALVCIPVCDVAEAALGGEKDDARIVADEYLTFPLCALGLPWQVAGGWWILPAAFVVNRVMDVLKPFPAYRLQALRGGIGIALDDIVTALYALAVNWLLVLRFAPEACARSGV